MSKKWIQIISATTLVTSLGTSGIAPAQDSDPDFKTEERFHRVYKKYNEQPTSAEAWEKVLSNRPAKTYSIQERDTLWDISNTLFGESNYWPKVWSYNTDGILNPHEINPQQTIKFYAGTVDEAPTVGLAEKTDAPEALPTQILEKNEDGTLESIQIPPPKRKSRPLVKKLPRSLPLYRLGVVNQPPPDVEVSGARVKYQPAPKFLSFYITDEEPREAGEVVELEEEDEASAGDHRYAIVRLANPADKKMVAFLSNQKVKDPFEVFASKGTVVEIQGELEILERVNDGDNLFRARIKKVVNPLEVGAKLMPGTISTFIAEGGPISTTTQARIIGGELARYEHQMFGIDNIVFLNAGAKEGLQEGSTLQIFKNERLRKPKTFALDNDRVIGRIKIIKLADHFATGYILDSSSEILIGDYAGGATKSAAPSGSSASVGELEIDDATESAGEDLGTGGGGGFENDPDFDLDADTGGGDNAPPMEGDEELAL